MKAPVITGISTDGSGYLLPKKGFEAAVLEGWHHLHRLWGRVKVRVSGDITVRVLGSVKFKVRDG